MKYILVPIFKTIALIFILLTLYPLLILGFSLWALWQWDVKHFKELKEMEFTSGPTYVFEGETYYIYKTVWDWYFDRKTWRTKEPYL